MRVRVQADYMEGKGMAQVVGGGGGGVVGCVG